jgi:hypothetical protein
VRLDLAGVRSETSPAAEQTGLVARQALDVIEDYYGGMQSAGRADSDDESSEFQARWLPQYDEDDEDVASIFEPITDEQGAVEGEDEVAGADTPYDDTSSEYSQRSDYTPGSMFVGQLEVELDGVSSLLRQQNEERTSENEDRASEADDRFVFLFNARWRKIRLHAWDCDITPSDLFDVPCRAVPRYQHYH